MVVLVAVVTLEVFAAILLLVLFVLLVETNSRNVSSVGGGHSSV